MVKDRRLGRFFIDIEFIDNHPEDVLAILSGTIVLDTRYDYARMAIEYIGINPRFDEVREGLLVPLYYITIHSDTKVVSIKVDSV